MVGRCCLMRSEREVLKENTLLSKMRDHLTGIQYLNGHNAFTWANVQCHSIVQLDYFAFQPLFHKTDGQGIHSWIINKLHVTTSLEVIDEHCHHNQPIWLFYDNGSHLFHCTMFPSPFMAEREVLAEENQ